ncbi:CAP domain-containing protein [Octadecabacter sp. 1_MG-2023]|uniref:CAP domain-containing protein n=1 Tax=unclassified Octadecabacter TaxID=196158 RepID=UPI001C094354|nr:MULTISPECIES: CAP domain-containing protein [unclassified Octadecabacter]MBU2994209.1 hypothetical protein [Octadecabacter sp. B2R22]MDO6734502.1 CAP domain-containing protein [Octadecabacter sp. 1_MG-2023]
MSYADEFERYMLELVNAERTSLGLDALELELHLNDSAEDHSDWMLDANVFSHTGENDSTATQRMEAAGFDLYWSWGTGENIAIQTTRGEEGFMDDVEDLHIALMNSPLHRDNILNPDYDYIGIGISVADYTYQVENEDGEFVDYTGQSIIVTQNFAYTLGQVELDLKADDFEETTTGTSSADQLIGTTGVDLMSGLEGNDRLTGGREGDLLFGGDGNDVLIGQHGDDFLSGGNGNDQMIGGVGGDTFEGGAGEDRVLYGSAGAGVTADLGDASQNTGDAAGDTYDSIERLRGSNFDDVLRGDDADNILWGVNGDDQMVGNGGDDVLFGMNGDDTLQGMEGDDRMTGGAGSDVFVFEDGFGTDVVLDFDVADAAEKISLANVTSISDYTDLMASHIRQTGDNTVIVDLQSNRIVLRDVDMTELTVDDFLF